MHILGPRPSPTNRQQGAQLLAVSPRAHTHTCAHTHNHTHAHAHARLSPATRAGAQTAEPWKAVPRPVSSCSFRASTPRLVHARVSSASGTCRTRETLNPGGTAVLRPLSPAPTAGRASSLHFSKLPLVGHIFDLSNLDLNQKTRPMYTQPTWSLAHSHSPPAVRPSHLAWNRERSLALDQVASTGWHAGDMLGSAGLVGRDVPVGFLFI